MRAVSPVMITVSEKMVRQWAGIERAMKFANKNPTFRPQVEALVDDYFAVIDEMAAELERRRMTGNGKIWSM